MTKHVDYILLYLELCVLMIKLLITLDGGFRHRRWDQGRCLLIKLSVSYIQKRHTLYTHTKQGDSLYEIVKQITEIVNVNKTNPC